MTQQQQRRAHRQLPKILQNSRPILEYVTRHNAVCNLDWRTARDDWRDQELLDKQFRWLDRSPANALLPLSIFTTVLLCIFLGSAITA